jgi:uncharacterized membrane protein
MRCRSIRNAAILLGAGLGGLLDGIVLHQVAGGWVQAVLWLAALVGILALWNGLRGPGRLPATRTLLGYMLVGWGGVKLAEGILNHYLLELHPVRDMPAHVVFYDWAFIILSIALILLGLAVRDGKDRIPPAPPERRSGHDRRLAY